MFRHCQDGILETLVSGANVKITMALDNQDSKGSASKGGRRRGCDEHTIDSVVIISLSRMKQKHGGSLHLKV